MCPGSNRVPQLWNFGTIVHSQIRNALRNYSRVNYLCSSASQIVSVNPGLQMSVNQWITLTLCQCANFFTLSKKLDTKEPQLLRTGAMFRCAAVATDSNDYCFYIRVLLLNQNY